MGFRYWTHDDLDLALGLWGDIRVTKFIDARGLLSKNQIKERLAKEIAIAESFGVQYWPIFLLSNDWHVGCCGLRPYDFSAGIYEIGFHIRSKYWQHGYAAEAARAVVKYAFEKLRAVSLFAGHHPRNNISRQLLLRLGFRYTHDEYYAPTGLNHLSYTVTMSDYTKLKNSD